MAARMAPATGRANQGHAQRLLAFALKGLGRDTEGGVLFGVCGGLARRLGVHPWAVRTLTLVALLLATAPTVTAYVLLALLLPPQGLVWRGRQSERAFWQSAARSPNEQEESA